MKSILALLLIGFACASAQGTDFLIDNIVNPAIDQITGETGSFLLNQLLGSFVNWLLGKRDVGIEQVQQVISQVQNHFNNYKDKIDQIILNFTSQVQGLFNLLNLNGPARSFARVEYIHKIADLENFIKEQAMALLQNLFQVFQQAFGQNFLVKFDSKSRKELGKISNVIDNLNSNILEFLENYGQSLLQASFNISELAQPLLNHLQQQISDNAGNVFQQIQQVLNQLQQNA
ncbi:hypothetical protein BpHYR1_004323 [Brachionus plicatilis]|uniref:Uncharacterized protein n=1 Tax=Brachionus plicatilis TaxID=10195 RepID=A0A3M7SEC3_BRAPC|nr:hypothetical protein BpHYR1_004323 [Brachionus plicatilis]